MKYSLSKRGIWKKEYAMYLLAGSLSLGLCGCGLPDTLFTDSGSDVIQEIDPSQYLDFSVLEKAPEENTTTWNGYDVQVLNYGTFQTNITNMKASIDVIEVSPVRVEFSTGTMQLIELLITRNTYLEKGDVIARVMVETDPIALEELELRLLRLEEDFAAYQENYAERYEEAVANISIYELPGKIDRLEIEQMERDHAWTMKNYETQIASYKERISELKNTTAMEEIVAPEAGFVLAVPKLQVGQELFNGDLICNIAPTDKMMLQFSDESWHYGYGMDLTLIVGDRRSQKSHPVEAVSALGKSLYGSWNQTYTRIQGDYNMAELISQGPYAVTGITNVMSNVLLVPVKAVTEEGEKYYVTLVNSDNTLEKKQFIPGGKNTQYYWVFDGLKPGMKIILEN
ncbi:MAG: hypothetical protein IJX63_11685 [Lachnospiraceae bacterium]|nr:hypothetical protein [Lachnospiraceae bacterium]